MANVPNIPSVVVTIEDRSYLEPILASGRTPLIPHFSKYGSEDIEAWSSWDEYQSKYGNADPKKYGLAQLYIKGASQFTQSFLGKRLLPDDATFANKFVSYSAAGAIHSTLTGQTDKDGFFGTIPNHSLAFVGKGRGSGYNDILIKFQPLREYEKFYADDDGIEKYKFNILAAYIYEKQADGSLVQVERTPIPFALVSDDPATNVAIKDIYDGKSLNVQGRFNDQSNYIDAEIKDTYDTTDSDSLVQYLNVRDIASPIFWDAAKGQSAYLTFEDGEIAPYYITSADLTVAVPFVRVAWTDSSSNQHYTKIQIHDGEVQLINDDAAGALPDDVTSFKIFGEKAFYTFTLSDKGNFLDPDTTHYQVYTTTAVAGQKIIDTGFDNTGAAVIVNDYVMKEGDEYVIDVNDNNKIEFVKPLKYGDEIQVISANNSGTTSAKLEPFFFSRFNLWKYLIEEGIELEQGTDGANLFLNGQLNFDGPGTTGQQNAKMLLIDFYMNNTAIREVLYPQYDFDYVPDFTNDPDVQAAIVNLTDYIQTAFGIHSCGIHYSYDQDIKYRKYNLGISSFNNALYSGQANLKHYDSDLGRTIAMPESYYALLSHLYIDGTFDLAEPVANVNKGALRTGTIDLSYTPTAKEIEKLRIKQINAIIDEPDGIYFIDQLTMYKRASILSRIHAIKPIQKIKKDLRQLLKEVLQAKNGYAATARAQTIIKSYMDQWIYSDANQKGAFEFYTSKINFDEDRLTIDVLLTVKPLRSVEKVNVTIAVV